MDKQAIKQSKNIQASDAGYIKNETNENNPLQLKLTDNRQESVINTSLQSIMRNSFKVKQLKSKQSFMQQTSENNASVQQFSKNDNLVQKKENTTGMPDNLKSGIENLSGIDISDVKVNYNSVKPAQLNAHAYTQGTDIHIGPGQEKHLAHEAWHAVQQKQGRVRPTTQMKKGIDINNDEVLEKEADKMGEKALQAKIQTEESNALEDRTNQFPRVSNQGFEKESGSIQLKGERKYNSKFSGQKSKVKKWIEVQELLGFQGGDIEDKQLEDLEEAEEEKAAFGWHHLYPFSDLHDNMDNRTLANHGGNLKLGPMANRVGDPGHEIDLSYLPGIDEESEQIKPKLTPLSKMLLNHRQETKRIGVKNSGALPKHDVPESVLKGFEAQDSPFSGDLTDFSEYWSEWYLSEAERNEKFSNTTITTALGKYEITQNVQKIIADLNDALTKGYHHYATHTPKIDPDKGGKDYVFKENAVKEKGIPSNYLKKSNFSSKIGNNKTQADLIHAILSNTRWASRGSQGDAIKPVERYKKYLQDNNMQVIEDTLTKVNLDSLKEKVINAFKDEIDNKLENGLFGIKRTAVINKIIQMQSTHQQGLTIEEYEQAIKEVYGGVTAPENYDYNIKKSTFALVSCPTIPQVQFAALIKNCLISYSKSIHDNKRKQQEHKIKLKKEITELTTEIFQYHYSRRLPLYKEEDELMELNIDQEDIENLITMKTGNEGVDEDYEFFTKEYSGLAGKILKKIEAKIDDFTTQDESLFTEAAKGQETQVFEPGGKFSLLEVKNKLSGRLNNDAEFFAGHSFALTSKENQKKYAENILAALRRPGKGYQSTTLDYNVPEEVKQAVTWPYDNKKGELIAKKSDWLRDKFIPFIKLFIVDNDTIQFLSEHKPEA